MTSHDLLTYALHVLICSCGVGIIATLALYLAARVHCRKPHEAVRGWFVNYPTAKHHWRKPMSLTLHPGQSKNSTLAAADASGNAVPVVGAISFAPVDPAIVLTIIDEQNANYAAAPDAAPGDYPRSASFVNSVGATITVDDVITVALVVGVAVSGSFVDTDPVPKA